MEGAGRLGKLGAGLLPFEEGCLCVGSKEPRRMNVMLLAEP